ncbi:MAG: GAF domain-containing SpoIIE family protein phosphatase [bacterium]
MLFLISNLALTVAILLFLYQLRGFQSQRYLERGFDFPPLLTEDQYHFLFVGFLVWLLSLGFRLLSVWKPHWSFLVLSFELSFTAATMYIALGLMYFAAFPIREARSAPSFRHTDVLSRSGLWILLGAFVIGVVLLSLKRRDAYVYCLWFLIGWQLLMLGHTYYNLRFSVHALRGTVLLTLVVWGAFSLFALADIWILETILLLSLVYFMQKAMFVYTADAHRRTDSFRRETEVMISFLRQVTGADQKLMEDLSEEDRLAGTLNLDQVLQITLNFALGLTEASAGAIFLLEDIQPQEQNRPKGETFLKARVVEGPYPPVTDVSRLQHVSMRLRYLNDLVLSERIPIEGSLMGRVVRSGETLFVPNASSDPTIPQQAEDFLKISSLLVVPLRVREETVGAVSVINRRSGSEAFSDEDRSLLEAMAEQAAITVGSAVMHRELQEKERLERDIELAREVQRLLLPATTPDVPGYAFGAYGVAAQQIGGDYYDFIWVDERRLALLVADVSGKGVPGALTMAMVRSALRAISAHSESARDLLIRLNEFIARDIRRDMFISMLVTILHTDTHRLEVARAGHDPLILLRAGHDQPELIKPAGIVLGLVGSEDFAAYTEEEAIQLEDGDVVVFYTDGITEAMNPDGKEYSLQRLLQKLKSVRDQDPGSMIEGVNRDVERFSAGVPQHDDSTLLVLKVGAGKIQEVTLAGSDSRG